MQDDWWYASGGTRKGPVKFEFLRQKVLEGSLSTGDLVWTAGMSQWTAASDVPALQELLQSLQPPELPPPLPHEFPPELPKPDRPELHGSFVATEPLPLETPAPKPELAGPWRRFLARQLDFCIIGLPTVFLVSYAFARVSPEFGLLIQQPQAGAALFFLLLPLILVVETIVFERFETTPGKSFLGIHITTVNAQTLTWEQYLKRQFSLYWAGLGTGFPLISWFTLARQYYRLKTGKKASYDEGLFRVTSQPISAYRFMAATGLVVALILANALLQIWQPDSDKVFKDCADCPEMVVIPAGSFMMGSNELPEETPIHPVSIRSFALGKYEVTQGQWRAVMGNNPSKFSNCGDNCPVEQVSWNDAHQFIQRLNQKTGKNYYLPSEAEWEYAARAGSTTRYWWGDMARREYANYGKDKCCGGYAEGQDRWVNTAPVGQFPVNPFGLHDMHGNVSELVEDRFNNNYVGAPSDGSAWMTGNAPERGRISRGGDWDLDVDRLRSSQRYSSIAVDESWAAIEYVNRDTSSQGSSTGFRLARAIQ